MKIVLYIIAIIAANVLTSAFPPIPVLSFLIPVGTLLIGFTFIMRDFVQIKHGRVKTYGVIVTALLLSAAATYSMGDGLRIVMASALSFALSEFMDTEVFTRMKAKLPKRVAVSGTIGSVIDSVVFTFAAGFPVQAIFGQLFVKVIMQFIGVGIITKFKKPVRIEKNGFLIVEDLTDIEDPFHIHHAKTGLFITSFPTLKGALYRCEEGQADQEYFDLKGYWPSSESTESPSEAAAV